MDYHFGVFREARIEQEMFGIRYFEENISHDVMFFLNYHNIKIG
jgi:hypothetical protein